MKLSTDIEILDNPPPTFHTTIADMHGEDGTEGSISIVSAPFGTTEEGSPALMRIRASQCVVFEHEGRSGRFDLSKLFEEWVEALGDRPEDEIPEFDPQEELRKRRGVARRLHEGAGQ